MAWDKPLRTVGGRTRLTRSGLAWVVAVGALVVYDVAALLLGWGTLSAAADGAAHNWPILAFGAGVVVGHLFWNNWKE